MLKNKIPSLNWLKVFESAARMQSFTKAAKELHLSPPAVSQQISALETHLGKNLFERVANRVVLTDAGKAYLPVVQQALQSISATTNSIFGSYGKSPLTIQVNYIFGCAWLASRLGDFQSTYPEIQLQLQTGNHLEDFKPEIAELQIKLGSYPQAITQGDILVGETVYPVSTSEIAESITQPEDLLNFHLIEIIKHPSGWYQYFQKQTSVNWQNSRFCYTDTTQMAFSMASSGFGIALAKSPVTDSLLAVYGLQKCIDGPTVESKLYHFLSYQNRNELSPEANVFRDWLLDQFPNRNKH